MRRSVISHLLRAMALCAVALPAAAQSQQSAPLLPIEGDRKDWGAWFEHGVKMIRIAPRQAEESFQWSMQLDPTRAESFFGFYAARMIRLPRERTMQYILGESEALNDPAVLGADSARSRALMRNPFVHRGLEAVMFDMLPGRFRDDRDTRAWLAYSNGEFLQAVAMHTRTIDRLGARTRWQYFDRALAYTALGNRRAALEDLRKLLAAVRADEASARTVTFYRSKHLLLYMIATLQMSGNDLEGAKTSFGEALVEDASFAYAHAGLAQIARAQQRFQDAADALTMAIDLAPGDAVLHHSRAANLLSLSRYDAAMEDFQRARQLQPHWPAPVYGIAQLHERQQRGDEARAHYAQYIDMAPAADPQARAVKQRLGIGGR